MSYIQYFSTSLADSPPTLRNPFENRPHPLAISASENLQQRLIDFPSLSIDGKMFGVLVISDQKGQFGYLSAFSGMLNKHWIVAGFVPPIFNTKEQNKFLTTGEIRLENLSREIVRLTNDSKRLIEKNNLAEMKHQNAIDLSKLKRQHQRNKDCRRHRRENIELESNQQQLLKELSQQSQHDKAEYKLLKLKSDERLQQAKDRYINEFENKINELRGQRKLLSNQLHEKLFSTYRLQNSKGEVAKLQSFFNEKLPPGGTGDCAAPKLIQFANLNGLKPLALAEFWWGASPDAGVRHHGTFYPPCRSKCQPILPYLLEGWDIERTEVPQLSIELEPEIVYEDAEIIVVNKPSGLLSIPGKEQNHSVLSWLQLRYPEASGAMLVHRLDMATSGILLAAKNALAHKKLQKQFLYRRVKKRYVAVLSKVLEIEKTTISLPLRVDLDDRPRQLVCDEFGKAAETHMKVISTDTQTTRVYFYPITGRTHQLRVHAAHHKGLSAPIVGDELYGSPAERLMLHAEKLSFEHPVTGRRLEMQAKAPF